LPGVGQTWSTPTVARVAVGANGADNTNSQKLVLIFGGGYDMVAESATNRTETAGNRIFMVDAESGALLWSAGPSGASLNLTKMTNAIPSRINVIDLDGDQFADRMYASDLGGRIWRFDITNGNAAGSLVAGGVIAQLGAGSITPAVAQSENRRFYNAPDVSLVQARGLSPYFNIAIGSGYRGHPLDASVTDRFYSLRDKSPFARLSQSAYNSITPILDGNMRDITSNPGTITVPYSFPGWKLSMTRNGTGEKVLAESTTVNNTILFTSFQPQTSAAGDPCFPTSQNRAYAVSVFAGKPALDFNDDGVVDINDLSTPLGQAGIAGEVNVVYMRDGTTGGDPNDPDAPPGAARPTCMAGPEVLKKCVGGGSAVRTFWRRDDAQ
jgi:type IV pilus assembly protein PilY1